MSWLDLEEGVLEEFSERASFDTDEFVMSELMSKSMSTFQRQDATRIVECYVCQTKTDRSGGTCSKRCTQIRRRRELIAARVCVWCKVRPAKDNAQTCVECDAPRKLRDASDKYQKTEQCGGPDCCNHVVIGVVGRPAKFCRDTCKNREMDRRKKERAKTANAPANGDRVLVSSCSSEAPDMYRARSMFIGKRGRVVEVGEMITVQFYGEKRAQFHANELTKMS